MNSIFWPKIRQMMTHEHEVLIKTINGRRNPNDLEIKVAQCKSGTTDK
jgi:hypothetical protein